MAPLGVPGAGDLGLSLRHPRVQASSGQLNWPCYYVDMTCYIWAANTLTLVHMRPLLLPSPPLFCLTLVLAHARVLPFLLLRVLLSLFPPLLLIVLVYFASAVSLLCFLLSALPSPSLVPLRFSPLSLLYPVSSILRQG